MQRTIPFMKLKTTAVLRWASIAAERFLIRWSFNLNEFLQKLNLLPEDYMMLIYNMTRDWTRIENLEQRARAYRNRQSIRCEQILTEHGICYTANNFLSSNLSTKLRHLQFLFLFYSFCNSLNSPKRSHVFRLLLTGVESMPPVVDSFFENRESIEVLAGNLFDGDMGYNMVGFADHITVNSFTSNHLRFFRSFNSLLVPDLHSQSLRDNQYWQSELLHKLCNWIPLLLEWSNRRQEFPKVSETLGVEFICFYPHNNLLSIQSEVPASSDDIAVSIPNRI